jgi:hypothetical protein
MEIFRCYTKFLFPAIMENLRILAKKFSVSFKNMRFLNKNREKAIEKVKFVN